MKRLLQGLMILAASGLILGLVLLLIPPAAWRVLSPLLFGNTLLLAAFIAIFRIIVKTREGDGVDPRWGVMFDATPIWMFVVLAMLVAGAVLFDARGDTRRAIQAGIMAMNGLQGAILHALYRRPWLMLGFVCPNGHGVSSSNRFCPVCGALLPARGVN